MATLSYSYADGVVFVEDLSPEPHPMVHDLCPDHADHLRVPRGWECRDARTVSSFNSSTFNGSTFPAGAPRKTA